MRIWAHSIVLIITAIKQSDWLPAREEIQILPPDWARARLEFQRNFRLFSKSIRTLTPYEEKLQYQSAISKEK